MRNFKIDKNWYFTPLGENDKMSNNECRLSLLTTLRQSANMSQSALAKKAGVSTASISLLEKGEREPGLSTALAISGALNLSIYALIGRIEYPHNEFTARIEITKLQQVINQIRGIIK